MGRAPCCDKANVKKGPWSPEEDTKLKEYIEKYGTGGNWIALPQKVGLKRCGKSCRLRWLNYLRPNLKHGHFSVDEDRIICSLFASIGSRWSIIAAQLPGRTDNDIKNYWNTKLKKKILAGIPLSQRKQEHHLQQQQQQLLFHPSHPLPSHYDPPKPYLTGLESYPFSSDVLNTSQHLSQVTMHHQYMMLSGGQSCSSSDGSCTQVSYEKDRREVDMGFESYVYGGGMEKLLAGNVGLGGEAPEYNYEDIKQYFPNPNMYVDEPNSTIAAREDSRFKTQGKVIYY